MRFGREGTAVAINYHRNERGAREALEQVEAAGSHGAVLQADVRTADAARALVEDAAEHFGRLDVASAAVYLCSDEAAYVNATTLMVDGGWSAYGPTPRFEFVEREGRVGA